jgi:hypothetical protein
MLNVTRSTMVVGSINVRRMVALAGLLVASHAMTALGQEKPPPTPIQNYDVLPSLDVAAWRDANARAGRPKWIVLTGLATAQHQGAGDPGSTLFNLDQTGITQQLRTALQEELNRPEADVRFVQFDALKTSITRLRGVLETRSEREALKLLGDDLGVRQALVVRIHTFANGAPEKVTVESMDMARGEAGFSLAFDWKFGTSARDIKDYSRGLAARFVDDYALRSQARATRIEVRVFGLDGPDDLRAARRALRSVDGVERVERGTGATGRVDSFTTFEVTLERGAAETDIGEELPVALGDVLKRTVEVVKDEGGGLALRVTGIAAIPTTAPASPQVSAPAVAPAAAPSSTPTTPMTTAPVAPAPAVSAPRARPAYAGSRDEMLDCVALISDKESPRARQFLDELKSQYSARKEPTFAVLVNRRAVTKREIEGQRESGFGSGTVVVVQNGVGLNPKNSVNDPASNSNDDEFKTISTLNTLNQTLEGLIYKRLGSEGVEFRRVDGEAARVKMQQAMNLSKGFANDADVLKFVESGAGGSADFVVIGTGTLTIDGGFVQSRYEFRIVGKDGSFVAGAPQVMGRVLLDGPIVTNAELERMADEAVSQMMCELIREWRRPLAEGKSGTP